MYIIYYFFYSRYICVEQGLVIAVEPSLILARRQHINAKVEAGAEAYTEVGADIGLKQAMKQIVG